MNMTFLCDAKEGHAANFHRYHAIFHIIIKFIIEICVFYGKQSEKHVKK